jgi:hypothetical protein
MLFVVLHTFLEPPHFTFNFKSIVALSADVFEIPVSCARHVRAFEEEC